jgi:hypothetical protein
MDLLQKIGLLFNERQRQESAQRKVLRDRAAQARAKLELLYDEVAERYPVKRREECPTLSNEAHKKYVLGVIATRSAMFTIAAAALAARAEEESSDWDDSPPRNLGF